MGDSIDECIRVALLGRGARTRAEADRLAHDAATNPGSLSGRDIEDLGLAYFRATQARAAEPLSERQGTHAELANVKALLAASIENRQCWDPIALDPMQADVVPCGACQSCRVNLALGEQPFTNGCGKADPPGAGALLLAAARYDQALEVVGMTDPEPAGGYLIGNVPLLQARLIATAKHLRTLAAARAATS